MGKLTVTIVLRRSEYHTLLKITKILKELSQRDEIPEDVRESLKTLYKYMSSLLTGGTI